MVQICRLLIQIRTGLMLIYIGACCTEHSSHQFILIEYLSIDYKIYDFFYWTSDFFIDFDFSHFVFILLILCYDAELLLLNLFINRQFFFALFSFIQWQSDDVLLPYLRRFFSSSLSCLTYCAGWCRHIMWKPIQLYSVYIQMQPSFYLSHFQLLSLPGNTLEIQ